MTNNFKNTYLKPTTKVVILKHRTQLLTGSEKPTVSAMRSGYGTATTETWDDED